MPKPSRYWIITATFRRATLPTNRQFENLFEIWLEGDHYKWRAMRTNGVAERFCTGNASPFEKFKAWAATVPHTIRNPLYHWTHLELKRYFGFTDLLDEKTSGSDLEAGQRKTGHAGVDYAGHPEKIQGQGRVHHGRSGGQPGTSPRVRRAGASNTNVARVPAGQGVGGPPARQLQPVGGAIGRRQQRGHQRLFRLRHRAEATARFFPFTGLPAVRPWPEPLLHGFLLREDRCRHLRPGAARQNSFPAGARAICIVHDAAFRPARCRAGLDQAASPRGVAKHQHAATQTARPGHGFRFHRRFPADARPSPRTSTGSTRKMRCRKPSFTI